MTGESTTPTEPTEQATATGTAAEPKNTVTPPTSGQEHDPVPYARFQQVNKEYQALKAKQAEADKTAEAQRLKDLEDQQEYQKLIGELKPQAERAKALEKTIKGLVKTRAESLSDEHRALIPSGLPEEQLDWLTKAEAAGLFGKTRAPDTHASAGVGGLGDRVAQQEEAAAYNANVWERLGIRVKPEE
jgi:hypothetical protein